MKFIFNDGGRKAAGYKGKTGDCSCRSIAIATGKPYQEVYDALNALSAGRPRRNARGKDSARTGVSMATIKKYMASIGWRWVPTMAIGQGCKVHLVDGELPMGNIVVRVTRHLTAVIDGVIHDNHDPQRHTIITEGGVERIAGRCVYGYFTQA